MMEYQKITKLDISKIESIKQIQKQIIMDKILNSTTKHHYTRLFPFKFALIAVLILLAVIIPLSLRNGFTPLPTPEYTIQDVYAKLIDFQERLNNLELADSFPAINQEDDYGLMMLTDVTKVYSRDVLDDIYDNQVLNVEEGEYVENYFNVELFLDTLIDMIENNQDIPLDEYIYVDEDLYGYNKFKFTYFGEDYIVIKALNSTLGVVNNRTGFKIGLKDDLLDIKTIHYSFDPVNWLENDDEISYNYFEFLQDNYVVSLNSYHSYYTMNYLSLIDGKSISVSRGENVVEGEEEVENGLVFNLYDRESKMGIFINIVNNEVVGESYTIYDDKGIVFSYSDYNMEDELVTIMWNMMLAEDWDQVVVRDESGYGYKEEGLYFEDSLLDIEGSIRVVKSSEAVSVLLTRRISIEELNNSLLNLDDNSLIWTSNIPTIEYIEEMKIRNLATLIQQSQIEGLNFFVEDIRLEIYNYLDEDIKNIID